MQDGTFVKELHDRFNGPVMLDGRMFVPVGWAEPEAKQHVVAPLHLNSLTGLIEYARTNVDRLTPAEVIVHVVHPNRVELRGKLGHEEDRFRRHTYAFADTSLLDNSFAFSNFLTVEAFIIALQSRFVLSTVRDQVIAMLASIRDSAVTDVVDDGYAQQVTLSGGVTMVGAHRVPNPVRLAPYRTFRELDQPTSDFVLRLQSGANDKPPTVALFEADGGAWKLEAMETLKHYLGARLPEGVEVIA